MGLGPWSKATEIGVWRGKIGTQAFLTLDHPITLTHPSVFQGLFQNIFIAFFLVPFEPVTNPGDGPGCELSGPSSVLS